MAEYKHREYGGSFDVKKPETDDEMRRLLLLAKQPGFVLTVDTETYEKFKPLIEAYERERDEILAANRFLFDDLYAPQT